jgi:pyridoxine/pyridoxamine 5'-phosphate oxidase
MEMKVKNLAGLYQLKPLEWERAVRQLEDVSTDQKRTCWLATVDPDGKPHLTGVGALWVDGKMYFTSGARTRKSRNLAQNPHVAISVGLGDMDLTIEGSAAKVTDEATVADLAKRYAAQGWPAHAEGSVIAAEFSAPAAGPSPWELYVITPTRAQGTATAEPHGATRWDFN